MLRRVTFYIDALAEARQLISTLDPAVMDALIRSLRISSIATAIAAIIGVPLGGGIALSQFWGKRVLISLLSTLMAVPTVVIGLFLYGLFTRKGLLGDLGWLYNEPAVITAEVLLAFPVITRLSISAVASVDKRIAMTLFTLGASKVQTLMLTLREASLGIAVAVITGYGRAISEVGAAMLVGGNIKGRTRTLTTAIALETSKGEFALGVAMGLVLLGVFLVLNVMLLRLQSRD